MNNRSLLRVLLSVLIIGLLLFSLVVFIRKQKTFYKVAGFDNCNLEVIDLSSDGLLVFPSLILYLPVPSFLGESEPIINNCQSQLLTNSTRTQIYDFVKVNPGVSFRGICSSLGIAVGSAQFHLGVLKKAGLVSFFRDGKYKRFFEANKFSWEEKELISLFKHESFRKIVEILLVEKKVQHSNLASKLNISSQGLTWNIDKLRGAGIIQEIRGSLTVYYSLDQDFIFAVSKFKNNKENNKQYQTRQC